MRIGSLTFLALLLLPTLAFAHGLGIDARRIGNTILVAAIFDSDDPADDAVITVATLDGRTICTGKTDAKGEFSFAVPEPGEYRITADAGAGHLAKMTITISHNPSFDDQTRQAIFASIPKWIWILIGFGIIAFGTFAWSRLAKKSRQEQS